MPAIGARFGYHVDVRACIASVRGVILPGLDLKLLNAVRIGSGCAAAEVAAPLQIVNLHAVHLKIVSGIEYFRGDSRGQAEYLRVVARYKRQIFDNALVGDMACRTGGGVEWQGVSFDGDHLCNRPDPQLHVESRGFGDLDSYPVEHYRFEIFLGHHHSVGIRRQERHGVFPVALRPVVVLVAVTGTP